MITLTVQGQVFQVKDLSRKPLPPSAPPKRGDVNVFSAASRRRLIDILARMDDSYKRATFVTLTFHSSPHPRDAKKALKRFLTRVSRYFPEASGVWRMEYQERGAVHFHIIFFNLPYWPQFHLQDTWTVCTDEVMSIAHIKLIRKFSVYMAYVSKYVAKVESPSVEPSLENASYQHIPSDLSPGRVWGYHNKSGLPIAPKIEIEILDDEFGHYAMWAIKAISRGHSGDSSYSQKLYTVHAHQMLDFTLKSANWRPVEDIPTREQFEQARQWFGSLAVSPPTGVPLPGT